MEGTVPIARVAGIDIRIHYTWLIAVALMSWSLATQVYPLVIPGLAVGTYWTIGVTGALLLFASVLTHELTHSLVARARGLPVENITLFIFGGVSYIRAEAENPRDEFVIAVVGPLSSLLIGVACWILLQALPGPLPVLGLLWFLFVANLLLAIFNMLPGFPLDGGRALRAVIWGATSSFRRATNIASYVGQAFAFLLIVWGVILLFGGNLLGGLWIAFIGWFLASAAEASRRQVATQESFRGVRVDQVMVAEPPTVSPRTSLTDMVHDYVFRRGRRALPVVEDGQLVGIATTVDIRKVPMEQWSRTEVQQIMTRQPLHTVGPHEELARAVQIMAQHDVNQLPVVEDSHLVGILSRAEIVRYLEVTSDTGLSGSTISETSDQRRAA